MKKYTNKYHLKPWVVKTILTVDCIIDGIVDTLKFLGGIVLPAFLFGASFGGIAVVLLKITGVIA